MAPFAIFLQFFTVYMHPLCSERTMWHHVPWCPLGKCIFALLARLSASKHQIYLV